MSWLTVDGPRSDMSVVLEALGKGAIHASNGGVVIKRVGDVVQMFRAAQNENGPCRPDRCKKGGGDCQLQAHIIHFFFPPSQVDDLKLVPCIHTCSVPRLRC